MSIVVQKYGGSSVADLDKIQGVARRVSASTAQHQVVVVVSAMGNTTNELLSRAHQVSENPDRRELDMLLSVGERITMALLAIALKELGVNAVSLTGSQSGIITDTSHADARVLEVRPSRVRKHLDMGQVVIVAGFQGVSLEREVTTLGRGGSDATAVVLAAALGAEHCEICSDVDGVYSADPRIVPDAHQLPTVGIDEALTLARSGAKVLYEDAVQYARDHGVVIQASSTFGPGAGTRIQTDAPPREAAVAVSRALLTAVRPVDDDLERLVAAGCRVRRVYSGEVWLGTKNVHGDLPAIQGQVLGEVAVVTAVGSGFGARADVHARVARALGCERYGAAGDEAWFVVDDAEDAARRVHAMLIGD